MFETVSRQHRRGLIGRNSLPSSKIPTYESIVNKFEIVEAPLIDTPNHMLENKFVAGLNIEIKAEIRLMKPKGLAQKNGVDPSGGG